MPNYWSGCFTLKKTLRLGCSTFDSLDIILFKFRVRNYLRAFSLL